MNLDRIAELKKMREEIEKTLSENAASMKEEAEAGLKEATDAIFAGIRAIGYSEFSIDEGVDDGFTIKVFKTKKAATVSTGTGSGKGKRAGGVLVDGIPYDSFAAACKSLGYETKGASAKVVLIGKKHTAVYAEEPKESDTTAADTTAADTTAAAAE